MPFQQLRFSPVVPFDSQHDYLVALDLTVQNKELDPDIVNDTQQFTEYISYKIKKAGARYAIGGYNEHRSVYSRSAVFNGTSGEDEPRRLHLGTDIWGEAGTPVFAPLDGVVHSFGFNDKFGDYGATLIVQHNISPRQYVNPENQSQFATPMYGQVRLSLPETFFILYGHLSLRDITDLIIGETIAAGQEIAHFGEPSENGHWPPHLHVQIINDIGNYAGDYPGVCQFSQKSAWLANSPDPDMILQMNQFIHAQGKP